MLNHLVRWSLNHRIWVIVGSVLLIVFGSYSASRMKVDVFPDLTAPSVTLLTEVPGMGAEDVERLVSFPVESAMGGVSGVRRVRSSSTAGFSMVWVEFDWDTDAFRARQLVAERLGNIRDLPAAASGPFMAPPSALMGEVMFIGLQSDSMDDMSLRDLADWQIRPRLLSVPGVSQVSILGGTLRQVQIQAIPEKLALWNIGFEELADACEALNEDVAGGRFKAFGQEYLVKGLLRMEEPERLGETVITRRGGAPVLLRDLATVKWGGAFPIGNGGVNGQPAVVLTVTKQPDANTMELTTLLDSSLAKLKTSLPAAVTLHNHLFRQADFIEAAVSNTRKVLWEGALFVAIVLTLFLMNGRATFISLLAIPLSLLTAMLVLKLLGITINTMTLGGMAIAVGDLVDDAIIDVENVLRRLKENALLSKDRKQPLLTVVYEASVEVRSSVINATFIIVCAFLPLFFLSGMEGRLLVPLGIAFVVALLSSLVVALTITPVLCSLFFKKEGRSGKKRISATNHGDTRLVGWLKKGYQWLLVRAMRFRWPVLAAAVVLVMVSLALLSRMGRSFLPEFNEGSLVVTVYTVPGTSLEESARMATSVEEELRLIPEITATSRKTGRAELEEHTQGAHVSEIDAPFRLTNRSREAFLAHLRERMSGIAGAVITIGQPISHRMDHLLSGTAANLAVKIYGDDLNTNAVLAEKAEMLMREIPGIVDINREQASGVPVIHIRPKPAMLAAWGVPPHHFRRIVEAGIGGTKLSEWYQQGRRWDMVLRFDSASRSSPEKLRSLKIDVGDTKWVRLGDIADVVSTLAPATVHREQGQRKNTVSANIAGRDHSTVVKELNAVLSRDLNAPEGYRFEIGGQFESEASAARVILLVSAFSLALIFFLLYNEFRSAKLAGIILLNLPLALVGGVFILALDSGIISIPAIIGFVTLFGISIRNGILLVSRYRSLAPNGSVSMIRVFHGSLDRLTPILITALTAGLALIPLALAGDQPGNEIQSPMAKVILGGLLSATLLNLFVVPLAYAGIYSSKR